MAATWVKGLILGFSIAAPLGPIGLLCMRRTLAQGWVYGLLSGLGAASADALYGSLAAFGLAAFLQRYPAVQTWMHLLGGAFIIFLGLQIALKPALETESETGVISTKKLGRAYGTTFLLTLSNPITVFAFLGMFAGAGVENTGGAGLLVAGVFCGSMLWWTILTMLTHWFGRRLGKNVLLWVNRLAGAAIMLFGVWSVVSVVWG